MDLRVIAGRAVAVAVALFVLAAAIRAQLPSAVSAAYPPEGREWVLSVLPTLLGVRVVGYRPSNWSGWLLLGIGLAAAMTLLAATFAESAGLTGLRIALWWPTYAGLILLLLLFPDGRPGSRGWVAVLAACLVATVIGGAAFTVAAVRDPANFLAPADSLQQADPWVLAAVGSAAVVVLLGGAGGTTRFLVGGVRSRGPRRRVFAVAATGAGLVLVADVLESLGLSGVWIAGALAIPVVTVLAITRYGLYDIDLLVHRALLYGGTSIIILAVWAAAVAATSQIAPVWASGVAAATAVVVAQPVRDLLQRWIDRLIYGHRRDPYVALTRLGHRIQDAPTSSTVLIAIAETVAGSLKLPRVSIRVVDGPGVEYGRTRGRPVVNVPIRHQDETVGSLDVELRSPDEQLTRSETALLEQFARQAGASVRGVQLTEELVAARERLVRSREEERRRLRRDLHDGIGPSLTGLRLQLHALSRSGGDDLARQLNVIADDVRDTVDELHRVVDGLRPPALDDGLAVALQREIERFRRGDTAITLTTAGLSRPVPAAVEVAVLRVVAEALTNVARHARARSCMVRVIAADQLVAEIVDDGIGLPAAPRSGVGLRSIHERASELGGWCDVRGAAGGGTEITMTLPLRN